MTMRVRHVLAAGAALALGLTGCDGDGTDPEPPFTLVVAGDASFSGAHGGQTIRAAVVNITGGASDVVASAEGQVSATTEPSFAFTFSDVLETGMTYEVHYWIDSNFGGGVIDGCDPRATDHQWRVAVGTVTGDIQLDEVHRPAETEDVCETFAASLDFSGDATFNGPHGGQAIAVAVVRSLDGSVVTTQQGNVSGSADPAFSFSFPGVLLRGEDYELHYWIDSNFSGGQAGVCDPPSTDHQWALDLGATPDDEDTITVAEVHDPSGTADVCGSFS